MEHLHSVILGIYWLMTYRTLYNRINLLLVQRLSIPLAEASSKSPTYYGVYTISIRVERRINAGQLAIALAL
jgi:hypothetical protein